MPAKQVLEIKTVSDGICIDTNIYVCTLRNANKN